VARAVSTRAAWCCARSLQATVAASAAFLCTSTYGSYYLSAVLKKHRDVFHASRNMTITNT